jgi:hypothetical protein
MFLPQVDRFPDAVPSGDAFHKKLHEDFEELFEKGDGKALDLDILANGQPVDVILLDCLCYQDDALFAAALELLERNYGQRKKLLHALSEVTLLDTEAVPVFGNVGDMSAELGFLTFLVRSSEVWGVSSRVSGPFQPEKYDLVVRTCDRVSEFLFHAPSEVEAPSAKVTRAGTTAAVIKKRLSLTPSLGASSVDNPMAALQRSAAMTPSELEASMGDPNGASGGEAMPSAFHQDVLRSMNLQATLVAALSMDYNLAFRGSICSSDDKVITTVRLGGIESRF